MITTLGLVVFTEFVSGRRAAVGSRWLQLYLHSSPNPSFDKGGVYTRSFLFISVKTMTTPAVGQSGLRDVSS